MKKFALILLMILGIQSAKAQNTLDKIGLTSSDYASVAFSLRLLSSNYTGNAIQVRRSSDDTFQDIGFTANGDLDTAALKTFVGSGDAFVSIWYDQSGNGNDLSQSTNDYQPSIVNSGLINRENGQPFIRFYVSSPNYNGLFLTTPMTTTGQAIIVNKFAVGGDGFLLAHTNHYYWNTDPSSNLLVASYASSSYINATFWQNGAVKDNTTAVFNTDLMINGVAPSTPSTGTDWDNIGADRVYHYTNNGGGYAELITFASALSDANRIAVENSEALYYDISIASKSNPTIGSLNDLNKKILDDNFSLVNPSSNSTGSFTYSSSNSAVATVNGNTITLVGAGTSTITATQSADATYNSGSVSFLLTVSAVSTLSRYGQISTSNPSYVNSNGKIGGSVISVNEKGEKVSAKSAGDGLSAATASTSAYAIKQAYPSSTDGYYWIANPNINGGTPFQIYADMTTDGGGWTLILCNASSSGWTYANAIALNTTSPSITSNYSIIGWADYIKKSDSGFQYMIDATTRRSFGGIWTANGNYSFVKTDNSQTNITLNTKFGDWNYVNDNGISERMPWYQNACGTITTDNGGGNWWGTLVSTCGWSPTPWISDAGGGTADPDPGILWYWVR